MCVCVCVLLCVCISYKGKLIKIDRSRDGKVVDLATGSPWETVTLTTLGRNQSLYFNILEEGECSSCTVGSSPY